MAREIEQNTYYDHSVFTNTYYASQIIIEYFVSNCLMKGDLSKIVYSTEDIAFRKRFELVAQENGADIEKANISALQLPFISYSFDGPTEPDDRALSVQPMQMIRGTWQKGLPAFLKALAVKQTYNFTAYFNRDDDARLAYNMLLWEKNPTGPLRFTTEVKWKNTLIQLPVFCTIDSIQFNPTYKEGDWLKQQRIIPITFKITTRTYEFHTKSQTPKIYTAPYKLNGISSTIDDNDNQVYLTERVILNFASDKQFGLTDDNPIRTEPDDMTIEEQTTLIRKVNPIALEIVNSYFQETKDIYVNSCTAVQSSISFNDFTLRWFIKPSDLQYFDYMEIHIPGHESIRIKDKYKKEQRIEGLHPNSIYNITCLFYSTYGNITTVNVKVTTTSDENNPVKSPLKSKLGKLEGMSW